MRSTIGHVDDDLSLDRPQPWGATLEATRSEGRQRPMWHAKNINKDIIIIIRLGFNTRKRKAMEVIHLYTLPTVETGSLSAAAADDDDDDDENYDDDDIDECRDSIDNAVGDDNNDDEDDDDDIDNDDDVWYSLPPIGSCFLRKMIEASYLGFSIGP